MDIGKYFQFIHINLLYIHRRRHTPLPSTHFLSLLGKVLSQCKNNFFVISTLLRARSVIDRKEDPMLRYTGIRDLDDEVSCERRLLKKRHSLARKQPPHLGFSVVWNIPVYIRDQSVERSSGLFQRYVINYSIKWQDSPPYKMYSRTSAVQFEKDA